jgi:hypothetical protein
MYYEYHLNDGSVEKSVVPNISSFTRIMYQVWDVEIEDMIEEYDEVGVKYCIIKEGTLCNYCKKEIDECDCEPFEDMYDRFDDFDYWEHI